MTRGMIFDMDGVLFDSHPIHRRVWTELLQRAGRPVSGEELDFILNGARREEILFHFLGSLNEQEVSSYAQEKELLFRSEEAHLKTLEGVESFLDVAESAGIPKVVATSASKPRAMRLLDQHRLTNHFVAVLTADDVCNGKSDPEIFLRGSEKLGVLPGDVVVFEDAVPAIRAAKSLGMKCVGIGEGKRCSQLREAGADIVASDFTRLSISEINAIFDSNPA